MGKRKNKNNSETENSCGICGIDVGDDISVIGCDGYCKKWFHIACVNMKRTELESIIKLQDIVKWLCQACVEKFEVVTARKDIGDMEWNSIMQIIVAELDGISKNNVDLIKRMQSLSEENSNVKELLRDVTSRLNRLEHNRSVSEKSSVISNEANGKPSVKVKRGRLDNCNLNSKAVSEMIFNNSVLETRNGELEKAVQEVANGNDVIMTSPTSSLTVDEENMVEKSSSQSSTSIMDGQDLLSRENRHIVTNKIKTKRLSYAGVVKRPVEKQRISTQNNDKRSDLVLGTNSEIDCDMAARKMAWFFMGRVRKGTTKEKVEDFLKKQFSGISFVVEDLNSKGYCESFKLGTDFANIASVMESEKWPSNILIRRFFLKRGLQPQR